MNSALQIPDTEPSLSTLPFDEHRGLYAMWAVIATELSLFICLFVSYDYLGVNKNRWAANEPPPLGSALIMLVVLLTSSAVLEWGGRQIKQQRYRTGRSALIGTILLGVGFLILQIFEYKSHWKELTPDSNSYGSIFYTITSFHAAHVVVGLLILCFVAALPQYAPTRKSPYRRYKTASLYWHFVDAVWVFIVLFLYIIPNLAHG